MNLDFDQQHQYYLEYNIKAVELGKMCNQYPALQKAWDQFKTVYELCKEENDENYQSFP
jgi:hypothetical protein